MTRRRGVAIALAIAVVAGAIVVGYRVGGGDGGADGARRATPGAAGSTAASGATGAGGGAGAGAAARSAAPALAAGGVEPYPELGSPGIARDDPLTAYKKANVYPPTSRPLSAGHVDLLRPNTRHESPREVEADDGVTYLFTADRYFVMGDEALSSALTVWRDGAVIPARVTRASAVVLQAGGAADAMRRFPIEFVASGGALVNRFVPATAAPDLRRQTAFSIEIEFDYGGTAPQRSHFDFQYTPGEGIPARFTGTFRDAIVGGSLVVGAGVAVAREGHYVIDCNLYDANDAPVAWSRFKGTLAAGTRTAELVFFGKVILDSGAQPPFHLGQLRGARFDPGSEPDLEQMPPFTGTFTTRSFDLAELSPAEWDSPDKQRTIRFLTEQAERGVHQGAASRPAPGPGSGP
jgi:hypothetical protein